MFLMLAIWFENEYCSCLKVQQLQIKTNFVYNLILANKSNVLLFSFCL